MVYVKIFQRFKDNLLYSWKFIPYRAEIDFRRHNLTSVDVRFWRLKSIPAL